MGLFSPAYKSKNTDKAIQAVQKITDPAKLKSIVYDNEVAAAVREAAVKCLSDERDLFQILCDTKQPSSIRKAAIPGLSQDALTAYASMDLVGSNSGGERDMVISRITDKKAVANAIWAKNKQCFMLPQLGYTDEDVIEIAQNYPAGSVQYKDCTSYAVRTGSQELINRLAQIMATAPVNKDNPFFDAAIMESVQVPGREPHPIDSHAEAEALAKDRAYRSPIARDWLLCRKSDQKIIEKVKRNDGLYTVTRFLENNEDWLQIALEIPELFRMACYSLSEEAIEANKLALREKAIQLGSIEDCYPLFSRLRKSNDPATEQIIPQMMKLVNFDHPGNTDIEFILDLGENECTDSLIRLFRAGAAAEVLERIKSRLVLSDPFSVDIKKLENSSDPIIRKCWESLRKLLDTEYKRAETHYEMSDRTGVSAEQDRDIRDAMRKRFYMDV